MILGVLGGLLGLGGSILALFIGGVGAALGGEGAGTVVGLGFAALPLSLLGIVGGGLALSRPRAGAWLQFISAVGGLIAISAAYGLAFACLMAGAITGWVGARQPPQGTGRSVPTEP